MCFAHLNFLTLLIAEGEPVTSAQSVETLNGFMYLSMASVRARILGMEDVLIPCILLPTQTWTVSQPQPDLRE